MKGSSYDKKLLSSLNNTKFIPPSSNDELVRNFKEKSDMFKQRSENQGMKCYIHNDRNAEGVCIGCGKFICRECNTEIQGKNYCKICIGELVENNKREISRLKNSKKEQPMVFMNAVGGTSSSSCSPYDYGRIEPIKNRLTAAFLSIFLGSFGIQKFYLGRPVSGLIRLLFCWTLIPGILGVFEGISYLCCSNKRFARKYGAKI